MDEGRVKKRRLARRDAPPRTAPDPDPFMLAKGFGL